MTKILSKTTPALVCWGVFMLIINKISYPETLTQANLMQISAFITPLFLSLILTLNLFLKNFYISFSISLGLIFLLILKALDSLGIMTGILIIISTGLLISYFKKTKIRKNRV